MTGHAQRILSAIIFSCALACTADYYYAITISSVRDGNDRRWYVKCSLDEFELAKLMSSKDSIIFPQSYAYMISSDKWEVMSVWDDLRTGVLIVRGENILFVEKLVANPVEHESKTRLFKSVPIKKTDDNGEK